MKPHKKASTSGRRWVVYLLCLLLFGGFVSGVTAMRQQGDEHSLETLPQVSVEEVFLQDGFVLTVRNLGRAEAARRSAVGFELPGEISHIAVDVGDVVRQGDLLATLDTARIEASRQEAVANLAAAEANLVQAEAELRRITTLTNSAVAAARDLDEAVRGRDAARAARDAAAGALARIDTDLKKSRLLAPYDGTIIRRAQDEGEIVAVGAPIVELIESSRLRVRAGVAPETARDWTVGQEVLCAKDGVEFPGVIERIVPSRDPATRTWEVIVSIDSGVASDGDLVSILSERKVTGAGVWLPRHALTESVRGLWACYVLQNVDGQPSVELRQVEVIHHEEDRLFVRGALRSGELVVVGGAQKIVPGIRVAQLTAAP
jgi:RND family efflux transporter MFP subunit